jgi:hypothetical protein
MVGESVYPQQPRRTLLVAKSVISEAGVESSRPSRVYTFSSQEEPFCPSRVYTLSRKEESFQPSRVSAIE